MLAVGVSVVVREVENGHYECLARQVGRLVLVLILDFDVKADLLVFWIVELEEVFFIDFERWGIWTHEVFDTLIVAASNQTLCRWILDILIDGILAGDSGYIYIFIRVWLVDLEENVKHANVVVRTLDVTALPVPIFFEHGVHGEAREAMLIRQLVGLFVP